MEPIPERAARPPRLGGRYIVTRMLGKGAQARVYLAFDVRLRQWRAAKVLAANYVDNPEIRARFDQEAQAMAGLSHPNLVRALDISADGATPFIVMELARGGGMTEWMTRNGPMPPRLACSVVSQVCRGLEHAHARGVVHRDVKPHNLLITDDGRVVLTDFGIARVAEGLSATQPGLVMGTFAYMAPEQRNDAKDVDGRADVYALGATLYTLLTIKTSAELFFAESRGELLEGVPASLRSVILAACKYDRDERIPTALALAEALEEVIPELPEDDASLTDAVRPLPDEPGEWLDPDAGVEDLRKAMALGDDGAPTYIPASRDAVERLLEEQSTTLYSDTHVEDAPTVLPHRMNSRELHRPRASISELSEEDVPEYVDLSSLDNGPRGGRREKVLIESDGVRHEPVQAAPSGSPAAPDPEPEGDQRIPWIWAAAAVVASVLLIVGVLGFGVHQKSRASHAVSDASRSLVRAARDQYSVIEELASRGGDRQVLEQAWFAYQDAKGTEAVSGAARFAQTVSSEAARLNVDGLPRKQAAALDAARREWLEAQASLEAVRRSRLGSITGDLGLR